jgi:hypothetical protein
MKSLASLATSQAVQVTLKASLLNLNEFYVSLFRMLKV